uniref:Glycoside hydrolase family 31 N-terminal domain-containing protein n=1 Tax=Strigamia maritima TaxID=126957 RepID=T1JJV6_STRMM
MWCTLPLWRRPGPPLNATTIGSTVVKMSETLQVDFRDIGDERVVLRARLGVNMTSGRRISCKREFINVSCLWDDEGNRVQITILPTLPTLKCTNFVWVSVSYKDMLKDCFQLRGAHWYGGGVHFDQSWPIEKVVRSESPFVTGDFIRQRRTHHGGVGERFWLSSKGAAIVVGPHVPLFVSLNQSSDGRLCLVGKNGFPYRNSRRAPPTLDYTVCVGRNLVALYQDVYKLFFSSATGAPDEQLLLDPIWSTWAHPGSLLDQHKVEQLAYEIDSHEFPRGTIVIGDKWEYCYGDMVFDAIKFPDPVNMMRKLANKGFRVALWIHPFSNIDCATFNEGQRRNYWVRVTDSNGNFSRVVSWWNGRGGLVDVTNADAVKWWIGRLAKLKSDLGVFAFMFDAGESTWLPNDSKLTAIDGAYPNVYSTKYVEAIAERFRGAIEVRVGYRTQHLPVLVRMTSKYSVWNASNGLRTIIPTALHFGLMGYPFIVPDVVGGGGGGGANRELLVRWLQLNVFLPAIELSTLPWSMFGGFDDRLEYLFKKAFKLRARFAPLMVSLAREVSTSGSPIVRPLWWISPTDSVTHDIDSEFLVGDSLLVAPILDPGATSRDIYLPVGFWYDEIRDRVHHGPIWLLDYKIELSEIAFFIQIPKPTVNCA